jgi:hypothetical protein
MSYQWCQTLHTLRFFLGRKQPQQGLILQTGTGLTKGIKRCRDWAYSLPLSTCSVTLQGCLQRCTERRIFIIFLRIVMLDNFLESKFQRNTHFKVTSTLRDFPLLCYFCLWLQEEAYSYESTKELLEKDVVQLHAPRWQPMRRVGLTNIYLTTNCSVKLWSFMENKYQLTRMKLSTLIVISTCFYLYLWQHVYLIYFVLPILNAAGYPWVHNGHGLFPVASEGHWSHRVPCVFPVERWQRCL